MSLDGKQMAHATVAVTNKDVFTAVQTRKTSSSCLQCVPGKTQVQDWGLLSCAKSSALSPPQLVPISSQRKDFSKGRPASRVASTTQTGRGVPASSAHWVSIQIVGCEMCRAVWCLRSSRRTEIRALSDSLPGHSTQRSTVLVRVPVGALGCCCFVCD